MQRSSGWFWGGIFLLWGCTPSGTNNDHGTPDGTEDSDDTHGAPWQPLGCQDLLALGGTGDDNFWSARPDGLYRWEEDRWVQHHPIADLFTARFATSPDGTAVYVAVSTIAESCGTFRKSLDLTVLHLEDGAWNAIGTWPQTRGDGLHISGSNQLWLAANTSLCELDPESVEDDEHLHRWDGATWTEATPAQEKGNLTAVAGLSDQDLWVAAWQGLHHWDGTTWTWHPATPAGIIGDLLVLGPSDAWAAGGNLLHYDGHTWTEAFAAEGLGRLAYRQPGEVWAAGGVYVEEVSRPRVVATLTGDFWVEVYVPAWPDATSVGQLWSPDAQSLWLIGDGTGLQRWDQDQFVQVDCHETE